MRQTILLLSLLGLAFLCSSQSVISPTPATNNNTESPFHVTGKVIGGKPSIKSYGNLSSMRHPPSNGELMMMEFGATLEAAPIGDDLEFLIVDPVAIVRQNSDQIEHDPTKTTTVKPTKPVQPHTGVTGQTVGGKSSIKSFGHIYRYNPELPPHF